MRYDNPELIDILSAEYVLGSLKGAARIRFEQLIKQRTDWAKALNWWQTHLHLLAETVPAVKPRKQVWQQIEKRLWNKTTPSNASNWLRILSWRNTALLSTSLAFVFATFLALQAPNKASISEPTAVAMLANDKAQAGWLLSLANNTSGNAEIRANSLASLQTKNQNAYELWLLPTDKSKPISLGLLPQKGNKVLIVPANLVAMLAESGLAVSLEPIGGSPTGQPTGAVLYQGKLVKV